MFALTVEPLADWPCTLFIDFRSTDSLLLFDWILNSIQQSLDAVICLFIYVSMLPRSKLYRAAVIVVE